MQVNTTVLGGLPITIEFEIFDDSIEDWCIIEIAGKYKKNLNWLYKRIAEKEGEEERIIEACFEECYKSQEDFTISSYEENEIFVN